MTIRDIDLAIAAVLMAVATILSRITDAAAAITVLALLLGLAVTLLGEDRLEALWRAYSAEPEPHPRKVVPAIPTNPLRPAARAPRKVPLAPARVVSRDDRSYLRVGS